MNTLLVYLSTIIQSVAANAVYDYIKNCIENNRQPTKEQIIKIIESNSNERSNKSVAFVFDNCKNINIDNCHSYGFDSGVKASHSNEINIYNSSFTSKADLIIKYLVDKNYIN